MSGEHRRDRDGDDGAVSDAQLLALVRAGDDAAYGELWSRHQQAARRLARQIADASNVDDLVSEAFLRVLRVLRSGGGPDGAFRPYLFTALRRINIDTGLGYRNRVELTADDTAFEIGDPVASAADVSLDNAEAIAAWRAWESLPAAQRTVLWHLVIEEETPAQIAPLMGTSANGVSSRAVRAKERLRQAFLQQHLRAADNEECALHRGRLGEYVRDALSARDRAATQQHLDDCDRCRAALFDVADVNASLRVVIAPLLLGGAVVAGKYLAAAHSAAAVTSAGWLWHLTHLRHAASPTRVAVTVTCAAGIAAAAVAAAALTGSPAKQADAARPLDAPRTVAGVVTPPAPVTAPVTTPVPSPPRTTPTRTRTPTPTGHPTSTRHPTQPHPPATPARTPSARRTTPAPTTSRPTPSPSRTRLTQTDHRVTTGMLTGQGTITVQMPKGWTLQGLEMPALGAAATCAVQPSGGSCTFSVAPFSQYPYTLIVTGPAADHSSQLQLTFSVNRRLVAQNSTPVNP